ncbi:MAG: hypothetical protein BGO76_07165 [Caedibacter sp. 38-128]|nr:PBP1A family penicillin-binding protein [Holosporales bacterium]OJX04789.1 MAG: hypothetical protein BGO76_07165 [Caedibacter sp. 38-128]
MKRKSPSYATLKVDPGDRPYQGPKSKVPKSSASNPRKPSKNRALKGGKSKLVAWLLSILIWGVVLGGCALIWFAYDLPDIKRLELTTREPSVTLLARDGTTIATYGDLYGSFIHVKDLPKYVPQAILATEDRRFYEHFGVDIFGIFRAAWTNFRAGSVVQGGSTITQQLAKNFLLSEKLYEANDRSLRRKVQEVLLALWLEAHLKKDHILSIYLNRVYLGAGVYGINAAAWRYFGESAKELSVYQAAIIAGLLKAPSRYSPISNPELAHSRARVVLAAMVDAGYVRAEDIQQYQALPEQLVKTKSEALVGRYFADWVFETLDEYIGKPSEDIVVKTTLDPRLQKFAEESVLEVLTADGPKFDASQASLVSMTPDGGVRAMVGGKNYAQSQFNRATQAKRQTGSSFKFFVFMAALEHEYTPETMVSDVPMQIGKWKPKNYMWQSRGELTLKDGFAYSVNAMPVRLAYQLGWPIVAKMARRLGLTSPMPKDLTIVLGSGEATLLELSAAYATIANHGFGVWPYGIIEVRNGQGELLYKRKSQGAGRILQPQTVREGLKLMEAAFAYGTGKNANIGRPCAGKTGTSQKYRDAWAVGFTPDLVTGIWMGNDDNKSMKKVTGGRLPAKIWKLFMSKAHEGYPVHYFPNGEGTTN